ncbi:hypothetical protein [Clostridium estertheticum]|nr:hypothetical protein [Clostridium estertheticum]MCB2354725.1 hypothetical protein [Clostridium estertheticum]WAG40967.1 hypothetical protein LL065_22435 [Clostridium estertheticum]
MQKIIILVLEVIVLIIKVSASPEEAARVTAGKYGVPFSRLWEAIPKKWK